MGPAVTCESIEQSFQDPGYSERFVIHDHVKDPENQTERYQGDEDPLYIGREDLTNCNVLLRIQEECSGYHDEYRNSPHHEIINQSHSEHLGSGEHVLVNERLGSGQMEHHYGDTADHAEEG